jgi:Protein of unknown function (DUF2589)
MPIDIGREMSLPMEQIIGGPMQALIKAQALAASSTADFINQVGLETTGTPPVTKARTVDFQYEENKPKEDGSGFDTKLIKLSVPLLTIVPVPYIRIEQATIDFEANVSSTTVDSSKSTFNLNASAGFWGVKLSVSSSFSRVSEHKDTVNRSAVLKVHVLAVQDEMPRGLEKVLDILESSIVQKPATP